MAEIDGLGASLAAAGISMLGVFAIAAFGAAAHRNSGYVSAFAVGLLSVGVLFHLIPEALAASFTAVSWIIGGFAAMVVIGMAVQVSVNPRADGAALTFGYASIIALSAHSYIDGVIYAAAFHEAAFTGWITAGGLMLHEFPEGVIAYFLAAQAGLSRLGAVLMATLSAGVTTIAGTLTAAVVFEHTHDVPTGAMLGGAAGALIYVLIVHLAPHAAAAPKKRGYLFAQLGAAVSVAAIVLESLGGGHGH